MKTRIKLKACAIWERRILQNTYETSLNGIYLIIAVKSIIEKYKKGNRNRRM